VLPLLLSTGAGFEMRRTLGTAVFSGMVGVTLFGIFLTPVFFYTIERLGESRLFASAFMRRAGTIGVWAVSLVTLGPAGFALLRWGRGLRAEARDVGQVANLPEPREVENLPHDGAVRGNGSAGDGQQPPAPAEELVKPK
jgi:hypothetical protein